MKLRHQQRDLHISRMNARKNTGVQKALWSIRTQDGMNYGPNVCHTSLDTRCSLHSCLCLFSHYASISWWKTKKCPPFELLFFSLHYNFRMFLLHSIGFTIHNMSFPALKFLSETYKLEFVLSQWRLSHVGFKSGVFSLIYQI